jgi:hypothetical protein
MASKQLNKKSSFTHSKEKLRKHNVSTIFFKTKSAITSLHDQFKNPKNVLKLQFNLSKLKYFA